MLRLLGGGVTLADCCWAMMLLAITAPDTSSCWGDCSVVKHAPLWGCLLWILASKPAFRMDLRGLLRAEVFVSAVGVDIVCSMQLFFERCCNLKIMVTTSAPVLRAIFGKMATEYYQFGACHCEGMPYPAYELQEYRHLVLSVTNKEC